MHSSINAVVVLLFALLAGCRVPSDSVNTDDSGHETGGTGSEGQQKGAVKELKNQVGIDKVDPQIQRVKSESEPVTITPFVGPERGFWLADEVPMYSQTFAFDPEEGKAFPPSGMELPVEGSPLPLVLTSFGFTSYKGGASGLYSNVEFDCSRASGQTDRIPLGVVGLDENRMQHPKLVIGAYKSFFLDEAFILYPEALEAVAMGGPFATLEVEVYRSNENDGEAPLPGATVILLREGTPVGEFETNSEGEVSIDLEAVLEPLVHIRVSSGSEVRDVPIPLPIRAAVPEILVQWIPIDFSEELGVNE